MCRGGEHSKLQKFSAIEACEQVVSRGEERFSRGIVACQVLSPQSSVVGLQSLVFSRQSRARKYSICCCCARGKRKTMILAQMSVAKKDSICRPKRMRR